MRFRTDDETVVATGRAGICCADDPAAEIALGSRSEAIQRSLVGCIEEVGDIGRVVNLANRGVYGSCTAFNMS